MRYKNVGNCVSSKSFWLACGYCLLWHVGNSQLSGTNKTRVIIMTDITSLTAGYKEPDDGQSLIRLMLYTNEFDIEGLVATSNLEHAQVVRPDLIRQVVEAYGRDQPNLLQHDGGFPSAVELIKKIKAGNPVAGRAIPLLPNIGERKDTEASEWIIRVVDRRDKRSVFICIWGGATDLAQALWKVKATRGNKALQKFIAKIRVRAIGDQDQAGVWIRKTFPSLHYVLHKVSLRGMYRGGDTSLVSPKWVENHIKGKGALGELYPIYNGGDIWTRQLGRVTGIKEGDTPSFLALLKNGLNDEHDPERSSWGGRFHRDSSVNLYVDAIDSVLSYSTDPHPSLSSVYRWRHDFQNDFAGRMEWCSKKFNEANHHPHPSIRITRVNEGYLLDASSSKDPDGDSLSFFWWHERTGSTSLQKIDIADDTKPTIIIPFQNSKREIHVIVRISDNGSPRLVRYRRIALNLGE